MKKRAFPRFAGANFSKLRHVAHGKYVKLRLKVSEVFDFYGFLTESKSGRSAAPIGLMAWAGGCRTALARPKPAQPPVPPASRPPALAVRGRYSPACGPSCARSRRAAGKGRN